MPPAPPEHPAHPSRLRVIERTGSTNDDLVAAYIAEAARWPHGSALLARAQTAGHGRLGRSWVTPPGQALTMSVLLRPERPALEWAGLNLVTALAVVRAVRGLGLREVGLKWPNDVVLALPDGDEPGWAGLRKLGGILARVVARPPRPAAPPPHAAPEAVVVGIGLNVLQQELPVPWATSLARSGARLPRPDPVLGLAHAVLAQLDPLVAAWQRAGLAPLHAELTQACLTLGASIAVDLGHSQVRGLAREIDDAGRLVIVDPTGAGHTIDAGDVRHLRAR